ncbi:MAG: hypothetical protein ABW196_07475 [Solirubrobacterales bacterium]
MRAIIGATLAATALAVSASAAQADTPAPGYAQFAGCPSPKTENPAISSCVHGTVKGGHIRFGKKEVPISVPIGLSGGVDEVFGNFSVSAKGGLEAVKQPVPGGLIGSTKLDWLADSLNLTQLKLYAVAEPAGIPTLGVADIRLPIKVHLINSVLGNNCYVGSFANPIVLDMTTGTTSPPPPNKPITGKFPTVGVSPLEVLLLSGGTFVDNSFAVPRASGCVLSLFRGALKINIDNLLNSISGLPAPAGTNAASFDIDTELVDARLVYP